MNLAKQLEKKFFRKQVKKKTSFTTVKGVTNTIVKVDSTHYHFQTSKVNSHHKITRRQLRQALSYMYEVRTATIKDMFHFTNFSSAMFALVKTILGTKAKIARTVSGLFRLTLKGLRFFFSTAPRKGDLELLSSLGVQYILLSFYYLRYTHSWKKHLKRLGLKALLDSGAFTIWQKQLKGEKVKLIEIEEYIAFIKKYWYLFIGYFNLDVVGDPEATRMNYQKMLEAGLHPFPVFHVGQSLDELERMIEEDHAVIGLGGTKGMSEKRKKKLLEPIFRRFPTQNFHFLGGASSLLKEFDWFSADSNTWLYTRKYNFELDENGKQIYNSQLSSQERLVKAIQYFSNIEPNYA